MITKLAVAFASIACLSHADSTDLPTGSTTAGLDPNNDDYADLPDPIDPEVVATPTTPDKISYFERAEGPKDDGYFKGSTYQGKTRQEKMKDLWGQVIADTSGPREPYWLDFPRTLTHQSNHALCQKADENKRNRLKLGHTQGVVAWVKYEPVENNGFADTILGSFSEHVLVRFSETHNSPEAAGGLLPSVAIKWLRDGTHAANLLAMPGVKTNGSWDFFDRPLRNRIEPFDPDVDKIAVRTIERKLFDGTGRPYVTGVRDLYTKKLDGTQWTRREFKDWKKQGGKTPFLLQVESGHHTDNTGPNSPPWWKQIMKISTIPAKRAEPLLELYAVFDPADVDIPAKKVKIGQFRLMEGTDITTSRFGDERLYFQHDRFTDWKLYNPQWKSLDKVRDDTEERWPNIIPNTWPTTEEKAKEKYIDQVKLFGCPFAWVLGINTQEDYDNYQW